MAAAGEGETTRMRKENRSPLNMLSLGSRSPLTLELNDSDDELRGTKMTTRRKTLPSMPTLPPLPQAEISPNLPKLPRHVKKLSVVTSVSSQPSIESSIPVVPPILKRVRSNSTTSSHSTSSSPHVSDKCSPSVFIIRMPNSQGGSEDAVFKRRNSSPPSTLALKLDFLQDSAPINQSFSNSSTTTITSTSAVALSPFSKNYLESSSSPRLGTNSSSTFSLSSYSSFSVSSLNLLHISDSISFSNLSKFNNILGRSLFGYIHDRLEKEEDTPGDACRSKLLSYLTVILRLHGNPADLFNSAFMVELYRSTSLSTVMRNQSVSVRIFQTICSLFDFKIDSTIQKLLKVFNSNSRLKLFTEHISKKESIENHKKTQEVSSAHARTFSPARHSVSAPFSLFSTSSSSLKNNFSKIIERILKAELLPPFLCYLCVQSTRRVEASELGRIEISKGVNLLQWTVASIVFLRFLVPTITNIASDSSFSEFEKKVIVLLGRFLMKLSCRSTFHEYPSSSMINTLLR